MKFKLQTIGIDKGTLKWHLLAWVIYILYACTIIIPYPEIYIIDIVLANLVSVISFYSCIPFITSYGKKQYSNGSILLLVSILLFFLLRALLYFVFTDWLYRKDVPSVMSKQFWFEGFYIYVHFLLNAVGYYFMKRSIDRLRQVLLISEEKRKSDLANYDLEKKMLMEERLRYFAESNFLRAQINPHFLHNILNFLYAQSLTGNKEKLSEGILLLSEIMRYSLQNQGDGNARVMLRDELKYLESYIAINQLRFDGQLQINFQQSGEAQNLMIIPLVLLTLLENAFKHGELQSEEYPLCIRIVIDNMANDLVFEMENITRLGTREKSTSIGITNTRKRLDFAYKDRYVLESSEEGGVYKTKLYLQLQTVKGH